MYGFAAVCMTVRGLDTGVPGTCCCKQTTPSNPSVEHLPTISLASKLPASQTQSTGARPVSLMTRLGTEAGDAGLAKANPPFLASRNGGLGCGAAN